MSQNKLVTFFWKQTLLFSPQHSSTAQQSRG